MSDLVLGMDTVGARGRRPVRVPGPKWAKNTGMQGVSTPQEEMDFLPFSPATLVNPSEEAALINFAFTMSSNPQRPFRGERFVFTAVNVLNGVDVSDFINIVSPIFVGMVNVGSAFGQVPLRMFANNAFGVRVSIPASGQGTIITLSMVALSVPSLTTFVVSGGLIGRAIR